MKDVREGRDISTDVLGNVVNLHGMFSSKLPQNRHPERSASQIYRVTFLRELCKKRSHSVCNEKEAAPILLEHASLAYFPF
jgi:hypothetical protein